MWWRGSYVFSTRIRRQWGYKTALRRASRQINKIWFCAKKLVGTRTSLSLPKGAQFSKSRTQGNESFRINVNEELSKFKDSVIEELDALKSSFLAEVDFFKKRHLISCGNDVLFENSEGLIKQLRDGITFVRKQWWRKWRNKSILQQLVKRDNIVVECNHVSCCEISDKMHCSLLSSHKEVQQNTTHEEVLLDTWFIIAATENYHNLTAKTGNGIKHQQNRKIIQYKKKIKKQTKNKKRKIRCHIRW